MSPVSPFKIKIPEDKINILKQKLDLAQFPDEIIDDAHWTRGPPLCEIERLSRYWQNGFNWRHAEASLNEIPQFTTVVDVGGFGNFEAHFIHQQSLCQHAIPLLFIHGWPGSFLEVSKILPKLVQGGTDFPAFHIVAPSLVNFGFSDASSKVEQFPNDLFLAVLTPRLLERLAG